jgi:tetratricopeptide (TPR) repeat protein
MHVLYPQLAHAWAVAPDEPGLLEFAWVARAYQERAGMRQTIEAWAARCKAITAMHVQDANGQDQVLSISRAVATGELTDFASVLFSIGSAYEHLGRRKEALEFYNRACAAQEEAGEYSALAITLNNIGSLYYELNQFGAALKYLRQSAAIHEQHGDPACAQLGQTYNNLGVICTSLGLAPDAVNYFALSLSNHMGRQDHASESVTRANLAKFHHLRGPLSAAVEQMHRVVELDQLTASSNVDKHRAKLAQLRCEQAVEIARGGSHVSAETSPGSMFSRTAGNGLILKTPDNIKQVVRAAIKGRVARLPSIGISND